MATAHTRVSRYESVVRIVLFRTRAEADAPEQRRKPCGMFCRGDHTTELLPEPKLPIELNWE